MPSDTKRSVGALSGCQVMSACAERPFYSSDLSGQSPSSETPGTSRCPGRASFGSKNIADTVVNRPRGRTGGKEASVHKQQDI
eukprot:760444-Hanusia_phi.AAC.2